ncbi:unnamed protein product [Cochlearia groenlandica]
MKCCLGLDLVIGAPEPLKASSTTSSSSTCSPGLGCTGTAKPVAYQSRGRFVDGDDKGTFRNWRGRHCDLGTARGQD